MTSHVHIIVPELFAPVRFSDEEGGGFPALNRIFTRADSGNNPPLELEGMLCAMFGIKGQSIAPLTLMAEGGSPEAYYWLRADPVHLQLRQSHMFLHRVSSLSQDESTRLCDGLNAHFALDGLYFIVTPALHWYLRLEAEPQFETVPLPEVIGKDVRDFLPRGAESLRWHGLLNEIQMFLYNHAVNRTREERGDVPVNSLWLWGGGYAPSELSSPVEVVFADDEVSTAMAIAAGIDHQHLSENIMSTLPGGNGTALVVWDGMRRSIREGDVHAWFDSLHHFELCCAAPLLAALQRGAINRITLDALQENFTRRYILTRYSAWRFWRPTRPFMTIAGVE